MHTNFLGAKDKSVVLIKVVPARKLQHELLFCRLIAAVLLEKRYILLKAYFLLIPMWITMCLAADSFT